MGELHAKVKGRGGESSLKVSIRWWWDDEKSPDSGHTEVP